MIYKLLTIFIVLHFLYSQNNICLENFTLKTTEKEVSTLIREKIKLKENFKTEYYFS